MLPQFAEQKKWARKREKYWGFGPSRFPINARVWYPDGQGAFPDRIGRIIVPEPQPGSRLGLGHCRQGEPKEGGEKRVVHGSTMRWVNQYPGKQNDTREGTRSAAFPLW